MAPTTVSEASVYKNVRLVSVRECEDNVTQEALLQLLEGSLFCGSSVPDFLSGKTGERRAMVANCGKNW